ncbi:MAG: isoprenylcysteine carboxylmethyltransferase family protein [Deltaproteobacteria bacterium]|nr:isoprenylcysteine carboxylmethyltransferase family protein [Deltaproteobacteria bacterium]
MNHQKPSFSFKLKSNIVILMSILIGGGSMLILGWFLLTGQFFPLNLGLNESESLALNALLCMIFFVQHSVMVRKPFQRWLEGIFTNVFTGAVYSIASGICILILVFFWQQSSTAFISLQGLPRLFCRMMFLLAIAGNIWGNRSLSHLDPLGIKSIRYRLRGKEIRPQPFVLKGPYRIVRHPLYLFSLMMIWSFPDLTSDRLLFNFLWTAWIIIGTLLEERGLVNTLGKTYQDYQKKVPMLIPFIKIR